jgi:glycosyltransferase involved in cell wall biosynthesis
MKKPFFIFISHSATLTGAPLIVSALVDFIASRRQWAIALLFLDEQSGSSMRSLVHLRRPKTVKTIWGLSRYIFLARLILLCFVRDQLRRFSSLLLLKHSAPASSNAQHYIYANSIVSLKEACRIKSITRGVLILHLHEMRFWITRTSQLFGDLRPYIESVDLIIAPSPHCIHALTTASHVVPRCKTIIIPEPCDIKTPSHQFHSLQQNSNEFTSVRQIKDRVAGRKLCVCNGTDSWRKGLDHFLRVASVLNKISPNGYYFLWVSLPLAISEQLQIESECDLLGIHGIIEFIEPIPDFGMLLAQSDCYLLTSREDPMPVSALEAMTHGIPVVCFANTGGIPDLLSDSPLQVVPYGDIESFAASVHALVTDPLTRSNSIEVQRSVVRQCSPDSVFGSIMNILDNLVSARH